MKTLLIACAVVVAIAFGWPLIDQDTSGECVVVNQKTNFRTIEAARQLLSAQGADAQAAALGAAMVADAVSAASAELSQSGHARAHARLLEHDAQER